MNTLSKIFALAIIFGMASWAQNQAPEQPDTPDLDGIAAEFEGGMPEDIAAEVEAAKSSFEEVKKSFEGLTAEEVQAKVDSLKSAAEANMDAALSNLDEEQRAKVEEILNEAKAEEVERETELRERLEAVEALKAAKEEANSNASESLDGALEQVQ